MTVEFRVIYDIWVRSRRILIRTHSPCCHGEPSSFFIATFFSEVSNYNSVSLIFLRQLILATLSAVCVGQDYEDYQPSVRQSAGSTRFSSQEQPKEEPIAILKQINRHNEDGSYTYGYEGADGSFKIETKAANGDVKGKYGYTDADGKTRVVEYGADKYGFQPSGDGITVSLRSTSYSSETLTQNILMFA